MRRKIVSTTLILVDLIIVSVVPLIAMLIRFEGDVEHSYYEQLTSVLPIISIICLSVFYSMGLYNRLWRYASIRELLSIISAVTLSSLFLIIYTNFVYVNLPRSVLLLNWLLNVILIGSSRLGIRILSYILQQVRSSKEQFTHVLIIGAGDAGAMIAREITQRYCATKKIIGFIDDSDYKNNQKLFGAKVLGKCQDIAQIVLDYNVAEIIIAMPSADGAVLRQIVHACKTTQCSVKTLPGMYELIDGKVSVQQLRNVDLEDLLRREPIKLDLEQIASYLTDKRILVTGAGGSIGSELCRQIAKMSPQTIMLLGKGENSIYEIDRELRCKYPDLAIEPIIADVRDEQRINDIFFQRKPQVVFHAGAHKHVPLMESQPVEAIRNNIFGTKTVAEAADRAGVEGFVMISTDKAVNPTSVMGATKRVAELIIQNMSKISETKFVAVRFGNVLGSRGSVIPLFKKQIIQGGPITITHPDMKRYFMTIPEASQLVLQAGALAKGGEVFVLDMGEPIKIVDMASDLIELSGLIPNKDIKIEFSGLRPGEKLFEELLTAEEGTTSTKHQKIFVANLKEVDENKLYIALSKLKCATVSQDMIETLKELVPTYKNSQLSYCSTKKSKSTNVVETYFEHEESEKLAQNHVRQFQKRA